MSNWRRAVVGAVVLFIAVALGWVFIVAAAAVVVSGLGWLATAGRGMALRRA